MDIVTFQTDIYSNVLISVVIPVYNVEEYLNECLDSVVKQTHHNVEIILIDDGSTDNSGSICDEYGKSDPRITVIHQSNGGLGHARNTGINQATGKYIIFLDSDDYWELNTLEVLVKEAEQNDLQVVVFAAEPFCDGIDHYKGFSYQQSVQNGIVKDGFDSYDCALSNGQYYSQACLRLYRLDYLKHESFIFDERIIHEDESFSFLAYVNAKRIECIGEKLYHHRFRPNSIMTSLDLLESIYGYIKALETIIHFMGFKSLGKREINIYYKHIVSLLFTIYKRYREIKLSTGQRELGQVKNLREIKRKTENAISALSHKSEMSLKYHLILGKYEIGYLYWVFRYGLIK